MKGPWIAAAALHALICLRQDAASSQPAQQLPTRSGVTSLVPLGESGWLGACGERVVAWGMPHREWDVKVPGFERVAAVALSPDGATAAIAGGVIARSGAVAILSLATHSIVRTSDPLFADLATCVAWVSPGVLAIGGADGRAALLDAATLLRTADLSGHTGSVLSCAARGDFVVTGSADRTVRVWDAKTGAFVRALTQHSGAVNAVLFEPDGNRLVSASDDRTVRLWDPRVGRMIHIVREHEREVLSLAWRSPAGLLSGAADGKVRRIDLDNGAVSAFASYPNTSWIHALALNGRSPQQALGVGTSNGLWLAGAPR